ncbi:peptide chain release factor 1 [Kwoniella newhampshirensis]|uniref:Peptide chain release factor 1 n=1 Tax=Kwoniella newhampshirensis TaxID=1651941 RepID=A0AAW0YUM8_9TREE
MISRPAPLIPSYGFRGFSHIPTVSVQFNHRHRRMLVPTRARHVARLSSRATTYLRRPQAPVLSCTCGCSKFQPGFSTFQSRPIISQSRTQLGQSGPFGPSRVSRRNCSTRTGEKAEWCTETEEGQAKLLATAKARVEVYRKTISEEPDATDVQAQIARAKVQKELAPLADAWDKYLEMRKSIIDMQPHLNDPDPTLREMFAAEHQDLRSNLDELITSSLPRLLLPPSPTASLPAMMSINAGVGGIESALCTESIARMYIRFAEKKGWKTEEISRVDGTGGKGGGGIRELTIKFEPSPWGGGDESEGANEVYGLLQWEKGVHRVQRIPPNETLGRIHTSTVAVVVLPIYPDTEDAPLVDPKDVKIDVMRARGAGGQHVNRTESAVRLTHIPTGITVSMQDSRSQHQNRAWAWDILRARLSEKKHNEDVEARRASRRSQVKGADRSDKIRTYNFNQDRLTDHRFGFSIIGLQNVLDGDGLEDVITMMKKDLMERRLESLLQGEEDIDY